MGIADDTDILEICLSGFAITQFPRLASGALNSSRIALGVQPFYLRLSVESVLENPSLDLFKFTLRQTQGYQYKFGSDFQAEARLQRVIPTPVLQHRSKRLCTR